MPYREAAARPEEPPTTTPLERFPIARYAPWALVLIILGLLAMAGGGAFAAYRAVSIVCTRNVPGAVPRCVAQDRVGFASIVTFELSHGSLRMIERESDDTKYVVIATPRGELQGANDREFAETTVAEANAYLAGRALRWEASRSNKAIPVGIFLGGVVVALLMLLLLSPDVVTIDRDASHVRRTSAWFAGPGRTYALSGVRIAEREDIDDSSFYSLVLVGKSDERKRIAQGREQDIDPAARAINLALSARVKSKIELPGPLREALRDVVTAHGGAFAGWKDLEDDARWDRMEKFLHTLRVDDAKVVRKKKVRRIELRGTRYGKPIRLAYDPLSPDSTDIEMKVESTRGCLDLEYDPETVDENEPVHDPTWDDREEKRTFFGPGVFTADKRAAKTFPSLPIDLQLRITTTMRTEGIRYFRVRPNDTTAYCHGTLFDHEDPTAHVNAVIDIVAEAAFYGSTTPNR